MITLVIIIINKECDSDVRVKYHVEERVICFEDAVRRERRKNTNKF